MVPADHEIPDQPRDETPPAKKAPVKKVSGGRNLFGLVLLLSVLVVGGLEVMARNQAGEAVTKLNKALENEEGDLLSQEQVETLIGRKADGPTVSEGNERLATYTWRGVFRSYPLRAYFTPGIPSGLIRISTE